MPLVQSLDILRTRLANPVFKAVLDDVHEKVRAGTALSDAFQAHGELFPSVYTASLMAGERAGNLDAVLRRFVAYAKVVDTVRKKTISALVYPAILIGLAIVLVGIIVDQGRADVLGLLRELRGGAAALDADHRRVLGLRARATCCCSLVGARRRRRGVLRLDQAAGPARALRSPAAQLPVDRRRRSTSSRRRSWRARWRRCSAAAFRSSTRSKSPPRSTGNRHMGREMELVALRVREGQGFAATLLERKVVPDVAIKMIEVGESTGALQEMLNSLADFYDEEIETEVGRFVTVIEPALLIIMGIVIAGDRAGAVPAAVPADSGDRTDSNMARDTHTRKKTLDPDGPRRRGAAPARCTAEERSAEEAHARRLAERYRLEFLDMNQFRIDQELFRSIPADLMLRYGFVPFAPRRQGARHRRLRSDRPADDRRAARAARHAGARSWSARARRSSRSSRRARARSACSTTRPKSSRSSCSRKTTAREDNLTVERLTSDISPIIRLVDSMIFTAIQRRASDIHIETQDDAVHVKYRIDGVLQPAMRPIAKRFHSSIISRIKVMAELDIAEKRVPQDGRFKLRVPGKTIDFRVSVMPSAHGEDSVIRILDKQSISEQFTELRLDILGFPELELRRFRKYIREPYGMVLVTGPTGSGKTTTLYAALAEIKTVEDKIITIEDPVEYQLRGITQIPINEKKGLTFARGLRSILRHDPDKIMVGEIRDPETAQIAIQSALTGHLVFTTVHANNVFDVLGRFLNMGVEPYQFISALNCVMAQRLVRAHLRSVQAAGAGHAASSWSSRRWTRRSRRRTPSTKAPAASSAAAPASRAAWRSASCST